jgi:hypothetical protein
MLAIEPQPAVEQEELHAWTLNKPPLPKKQLPSISASNKRVQLRRPTPSKLSTPALPESSKVIRTALDIPNKYKSHHDIEKSLKESDSHKRLILRLKAEKVARHQAL